jgi:hypothetical protein
MLHWSILFFFLKLDILLTERQKYIPLLMQAMHKNLGTKEYYGQVQHSLAPLMKYTQTFAVQNKFFRGK